MLDLSLGQIDGLVGNKLGILALRRNEHDHKYRQHQYSGLNRQGPHQWTTDPHAFATPGFKR
ncbi:MAG: hypothetical protein BWY82_02770 [Verrucomicrobia bacterium ADurb.Bin474]|nr:MAG: hypothetical protein BWY82_02770 [Verrucomicrobia bacterium ADurb.Bin474]